MASVIQDWVQELPWKQQSILFSGLRGPDTPGNSSIKVVNRWMRAVSQHNADPSKGYMTVTALPSEMELCEELEYLPCHYVHHFADALAVIAYGHPEGDVAEYASRIHYRIAEEIFHFRPEPAFVFELRHRDKPEGVDPRAEEWNATQRQWEQQHINSAMARFR